MFLHPDMTGWIVDSCCLTDRESGASAGQVAVALHQLLVLLHHVAVADGDAALSPRVQLVVLRRRLWGSHTVPLRRSTLRSIRDACDQLVSQCVKRNIPNRHNQQPSVWPVELWLILSLPNQLLARDGGWQRGGGTVQVSWSHPHCFCKRRTFSDPID